jgi:hypothetical protein
VKALVKLSTAAAIVFACANAQAAPSWTSSPDKPCLVTKSAKSELKMCPSGNTYRRTDDKAQWTRQTYSCAFVKNEKDNWKEIFCNNGQRWRGPFNGAMKPVVSPPPKTVYVPVPGGSPRLQDLQDQIDDLPGAKQTLGKRSSARSANKCTA